jgi:ATP-dependent DNA helicase RecQ
MPRRRHLIESDSGRGIASEESVQHKWNLFLELMRFAEGGSCRHDSVLRYFGDEDETLSGCGRCDVCLQLDTGEQDQLDASPEDVTLIVRKALAGVARVHGKYGLGAAVSLLRGQKDPRLEKMALQTSTTFGVLSQFTEDWLTRLLRRCITAGWVDFWGGDRPVVILSAEGAEVMQGKRNVRLLLPPLIKPGRGGSSTKRKSGGNKAGPDPEIFDQAEQELFEALRNHRLEVARAQSVPPYVVASDRTLREIVLDRPESDADLQRVHGIGAAKAERYGAGLLAVVADWRVRNPG